MLAALLVSLLAPVAPLARATPAAPDAAVRLWLNNDRRFVQSDRAKVQVETADDGYLLVLHADPDGRLRVLFPLDPGDDNYVRGGKRYEIRGRGGRESFQVEYSSGRGTVLAAVSHDPFHFDGYILGDHWDYKVLSATRLAEDAEPELVETARRMTGGKFDYDVLNYDVSGASNYALAPSYDNPTYITPSYISPTYYDPFYTSCDPFWNSCGYNGGLTVALSFGRPYHRYRYFDPYFYGGYNPFYYGYGPSYYDPFYRRPYDRPYGGWNNGGVYGHYGDTPYRFKSGDRTWNGNAGSFRGTNVLAVNNVYNPFPARGQGVNLATPLRRRDDQPIPTGGAVGGSPVSPTRRQQVPAGGYTGSPVSPTRRAAPAPARAPSAQPVRPADGSAVSPTPTPDVQRRPAPQGSPVSPRRQETERPTPQGSPVSPGRRQPSDRQYQGSPMSPERRAEPSRQSTGAPMSSSRGRQARPVAPRNEQPQRVERSMPPQSRGEPRVERRQEPRGGSPVSPSQGRERGERRRG